MKGKTTKKLCNPCISPSSHNRSWMENGCISNILFPFITFRGHGFHWTMILAKLYFTNLDLPWVWPLPRIPVTTRIMTLLGSGIPIINLDLPLASWEGATPKIYLGNKGISLTKSPPFRWANLTVKLHRMIISSLWLSWPGKWVCWKGRLAGAGGW